MQIKFLNFLEVAQLFLAFERGELEQKPEVQVIKTAGYVSSIRERIQHFVTEANDIEEGLENYYAKEGFHTFEISSKITRNQFLEVT